jgi:hypothetical protein
MLEHQAAGKLREPTARQSRECAAKPAAICANGLRRLASQADQHNARCLSDCSRHFPPSSSAFLDVDAGIASARARDERIPSRANLPFSEFFNKQQIVSLHDEPAGPTRSGVYMTASRPRFSPAKLETDRAARRVPATYGAAEAPASWRITRRSLSAPRTTSHDSTNDGMRREWIWIALGLPKPPPRVSRTPESSATGLAVDGRRIGPRSSANSRAVPEGVSILPGPA